LKPCCLSSLLGALAKLMKLKNVMSKLQYQQERAIKSTSHLFLYFVLAKCCGLVDEVLMSQALGKILGLRRAISLEIVLNPRGAFREEIELKKSFLEINLIKKYSFNTVVFALRSAENQFLHNPL